MAIEKFQFLFTKMSSKFYKGTGIRTFSETSNILKGSYSLRKSGIAENITFERKLQFLEKS